VSLDTITYVLASLRRASDNAYPWSLTPHEAGALVAEVERLREERRIDNEDLARAYDFARDKATSLERQRVVALLRTLDDRWGTGGSPCSTAADLIENGEHVPASEKP
jgi:hypothetical protein